jgi:hypothetical protein
VFLRSLVWVLAAIAAVGIVAVGSVLASEPMETRERLALVAALPVMGIFIWACIGPPLEGRAMWTAATVFAVSLLVLFATLLGETQSAAAWAGVVALANACGLMLLRRGRPAQR